MDQNEILILIMVISCGLCILYGIYKRPSYFFVLLLRGIICSGMIHFICIFCNQKGFLAPVNLNLLSVGTGTLLGVPGVVSLYVISIFLT